MTPAEVPYFLTYEYMEKSYEALRAKMSDRAHQEIYFTFIVIREQISIFTIELCTFYMY